MSDEHSTFAAHPLCPPHLRKQVEEGSEAAERDADRAERQARTQQQEEGAIEVVSKSPGASFSPPQATRGHLESLLPQPELPRCCHSPQNSPHLLPHLHLRRQRYYTKVGEEGSAEGLPRGQKQRPRVGYQNHNRVSEIGQENCLAPATARCPWSIVYVVSSCGQILIHLPI